MKKIRKSLKIISGGQAGADRAALDFALSRKISCGGWCPAGRIAEDGPIPSRYPLRETSGIEPAERTRKNVDESDGTLLIVPDEADDGTRYTSAYARETRKPLYRVTKDDIPEKQNFLLWLDINRIRVLNVAGPRESNIGGSYDFTLEVLGRLLD